MEHFEEDLEDLVSAEDFLEYFKIDYDASVVHVNRLHILQRFHQYMSKQPESEMVEPEVRYNQYRAMLSKAYQDFVESNAQTEKVFKVFHMNDPQTAFVPVEDLLGQ